MKLYIKLYYSKICKTHLSFFFFLAFYKQILDLTKIQMIFEKQFNNNSTRKGEEQGKEEGRRTKEIKP